MRSPLFALRFNDLLYGGPAKESSRAEKSFHLPHKQRQREQHHRCVPTRRAAETKRMRSSDWPLWDLRVEKNSLGAQMPEPIFHQHPSHAENRKTESKCVSKPE